MGQPNHFSGYCFYKRIAERWKGRTQKKSLTGQNRNLTRPQIFCNLSRKKKNVHSWSPVNTSALHLNWTDSKNLNTFVNEQYENEKTHLHKHKVLVTFNLIHTTHRPYKNIVRFPHNNRKLYSCQHILRQVYTFNCKYF